MANDCGDICDTERSSSASMCKGGFQNGCSVTCDGSMPTDVVTTDSRHWDQCYDPHEGGMFDLSLSCSTADRVVSGLRCCKLKQN
ncbi:hypothetical protein VKT23_006837 [Stygiomarasmius scandens]|uniref:Uncharacterized protein n=1 Tax=Marasmiellus scandens TaxID=2682957 RepID=A0ABR1JMA5_9AGAR